MQSNDDTHRIVYTGNRGLVARGLAECLVGRGHALLPSGARRRDLLPAIERERPDIVLVCPTRPGHRAFTLTRAVVERRPDLPLLLLALRADDEQVVADAVDVGVRGCLDVNANCSDLRDAVRLAIDGRSLFTTRQMQLAASVESLTVRQIEIVQSMRDGLSTDEVAWELGVSSHTVRNHLAEIRSRLRVNTTSEAIRRALRRGWLESD